MSSIWSERIVNARRTWLLRSLSIRWLLAATATLAGCQAPPTSNDREPANRTPSPVITVGSETDPTTLMRSAGQAITLNAGGSNDADGDRLTYTWDFGDGSDPLNGAEVTYTYIEAGAYTITLTITDGRGLASSTVTRTIAITITAANPVAAFTWTPITGQAPLEITFDASNSSDSDGTIASYSWDFDEDGTEDATGVNAVNTFGAGGTFSVMLTVTDDDGNTASDINQVVVQASPPAPVAPTVTVTASLTTAEIGALITFTATANDPDGDELALTYAWDFDDGGTATTAVAMHSFAAAGTYEVSVTVTDAQLLTATATVNIVVEAANLAPSAVISAVPTSGLSPLEVVFSSAGSSDPEETTIFSYLWDFDDTGLLVTMSNPTHEYTASGDYEATLTVYDSSNTASEPVTVAIEVRTVESLAADVTNVNLSPAETQQLLMTATLDSAFNDGTDTMDVTADANTTYTSDDELIATVSATGLITALAEGTATIEIDRPELTTPVLVNVVVANPLAASATADVTLLAPGGTVTLTATATGGVLPLTYDWNVVPNPLDPNLDDLDFADQTNASTTIVLPEEGVYEFNCTVTDSRTVPVAVTTANVSATVTSMVAAFTRIDDHPTDTCAVAAVSAVNVPNGANGPATAFGSPETLITLDADITGGSLDFSYAWSVSPASVGTLDATGLELNQISYLYPLVPISGVTEVLITVTVTDNITGAVVDFTYDPFKVVPAPELTDICVDPDVPACPTDLAAIGTGGAETVVTVTFYLDENTGHVDDLGLWTTQYQMTESPDTGDSSVEAACTSPTEFGAVPVVTCDITFAGTANGSYTYRIRLRETCEGDIDGTQLPRFDNFFTLDVAP